MPTANEGSTDRTIRIILGIILGYLGLTNTAGTAQVLMIIIASVLLITGLTGFCAIYKLLNINTCGQTS